MQRTANILAKIRAARAARLFMLLTNDIIVLCRCRSRSRRRFLNSLIFEGNSALLPSDVIDFALLPAQRLLAGLDVM